MKELFFGQSTGHSILILAFVIATGLYLGKFKIKGISLGATWILFMGIVLSHFGFRVDANLLHFMREFGLILFVFSIGLQVGPGFFQSFKAGGVKLNLLAVALVLLAVATTYIIHIVTGEDLTTMVGVMSGAVTNTPGLGAAQEAIFEVTAGNPAAADAARNMSSSLASGLAVAYPIGVLGGILVLILLKAMFKINLKSEVAALEGGNNDDESAIRIAFELRNPALYDKEIQEIDKEIVNKFVISRLYRKGVVSIPSAETKLLEGDKLLVITSRQSEDIVRVLFGKEIQMDKKEWERLDNSLLSKSMTITKSNITGKTLRDLNIRASYGVSITRVSRSGVDLVANPNLVLQLGDTLRVVGPENSIKKLKNLLGDSNSGLNQPYLIPIFFGIVLGVVLGSIPINIPGMPQSIKLGLASGPLIVAILIGYFGPKLGITTYTTTSANLMIREIGIDIFLAAVGLSAGETFVSAVIGGGYWWFLYGAIITIVPSLIIAILGRLVFKLNFYQLCGLLTGGSTNPPALAFAQDMYGTDYASVNYATVFPFAMFMRVLVAQLLVLLALI